MSLSDANKCVLCLQPPLQSTEVNFAPTTPRMVVSWGIPRPSFYSSSLSTVLNTIVVSLLKHSWLIRLLFTGFLLQMFTGPGCTFSPLLRLSALPRFQITSKTCRHLPSLISSGCQWETHGFWNWIIWGKFNKGTLQSSAHGIGKLQSRVQFSGLVTLSLET